MLLSTQGSGRQHSGSDWRWSQSDSVESRAKRLGANDLSHRTTGNRGCNWASIGATDVITTRDEQAVQEVLEQTHGGAEAVLECVGTLDSHEHGDSHDPTGQISQSLGFYPCRRLLI